MRNIDDIWNDLQPWLEERERTRKRVIKNLTQAVLFGVVLGVVIATIAIFSTEIELPIASGIVFAGAVVGGLFRIIPITELHSEVKTGLNTRLAEVFGMNYQEEVHVPPRFRAFQEHGLLPHENRKSFEDMFSGEVHGAEFQLYEAHLEQKRRTRKRTYYVTVFRGVLLRIRFPRTVEGVTLVTRDKGWFNALEGWSKKSFGNKLERIGLVDPTFEKLFEVYGTDQVMARYLLTPSFMERLLELETLLKGKNVRCVFDESLAEGDGAGELLIAAETGNQFEPGSMFSALDEREPLERLHGEIQLIERIVETLLEPATER